MYYAKTLAFVACLSPKRFRKIRSLLATSIDRLALDDRSYFYSPGNYEVRYGDGAVQDILSCRALDRFDPEEALETTLMLMACEDPDAEKHVFVFLDGLRILRQVARPLRIDDRQGTECQFHFVALGDEMPELLDMCQQRERCDYRRVEDIRDIAELARSLC